MDINNSKLLIILLTSMMLLTSSLQAAEISGKAPDFTLKSRSGKNIRLAELRGKVVMLNFWASWCTPCREEMPLLEKIHQRYESLGFTLLGINIENTHDDVKKFLSDVKVSFPVLYDTTNKVSELYSISAMPTTILIDRDGNMRFLHKGYKPGYEESYRQQVKTLLKE